MQNYAKYRNQRLIYQEKSFGHKKIISNCLANAQSFYNYTVEIRHLIFSVLSPIGKATKIEQFILRVSNSPVVKNGKKKTNNWLDHQDVCQRLKISKRTLQTLRDNGTLAYTKIGNRTYYLPEDVESIVTKVEDRRKEARWKGREI